MALDDWSYHAEWFLDHKVVIIVTTLLIGVVHYNEWICNSYRYYRFQGLGLLEIITTLCLSAVETLRAAGQLAGEWWSRPRRRRSFEGWEMPELEEVAIPAPPTPPVPPFAIAPAFEDDRLYPPGWLVFHPVLGVVPKGTADEYQSGAVSNRTGSAENEKR